VVYAKIYSIYFEVRKMIIVAKFGGSSVANASQFKKIKQIVAANENRKIVICSALGKRTPDDSKVTDLLYLLSAHIKYSVPFDHIFVLIKNRFLEIKKELDLNIDLETYFDDFYKELKKGISEDYLVSRGEFFTTILMADYLGYDFIDSKDIISFNYDGTINQTITKEKIEAECLKHAKVAIPGFYGAYSNGVIKLLSRGGSDITGALVSKALNASMYENWTDVSGILMADPKVVKNPKQIKEITYNELRELSYMGANVLHEETIFPVQELHIPINIRNTNIPEDQGTIISHDCSDNSQIITGIAGKKFFSSITVSKTYGASKTKVIKDTLEVFEKFGVSVEHIPSSIDSFSIVVSSEEISKCVYDLISEVRKLNGVYDIKVEDNIALIAVVGRNMVNIPGISGRLFAIFGEKKINIKMIAQGNQEINIIVGVSNSDYEYAIQSIYDNFVK